MGRRTAGNILSFTIRYFDGIGEQSDASGNKRSAGLLHQKRSPDPLLYRLPEDGRTRYPLGTGRCKAYIRPACRLDLRLPGRISSRKNAGRSNGQLKDRYDEGRRLHQCAGAGIDIGILDAVIISGYPGTMMSTRQQAGRAGRKGGESLAILVAQANPLDQYFMQHPASFFSRSHEHAIVDTDKPVYRFRSPPLCCGRIAAP